MYKVCNRKPPKNLDKQLHYSTDGVIDHLSIVRLAQKFNVISGGAFYVDNRLNLNDFCIKGYNRFKRYFYSKQHAIFITYGATYGDQHAVVVDNRMAINLNTSPIKCGTIKELMDASARYDTIRYLVVKK